MDYFDHISKTAIITYKPGTSYVSGTDSYVVDALNKITPYLKAAGFTTGVLSTTYAIALIMAQSNYMRDPAAIANNNYAAIKWVPYEDASQGTGGMARFLDINHFCRYYLHVLSINLGQGRPTEASTAQQFANALANSKFITFPHAQFNASLRAISQAITSQHNEQAKTTAIINDVYTEANRILSALRSVGLNDYAASYATYQAYHESAAFKDYKYRQYNNPTGIKYAGQNGASAGNNNYAVFTSLGAWANAMKHELTKGSNPSAAVSLEDYAARLKSNGYYEDTQNNYTAGLKAARLVLKSMPAEQRAGTDQNKKDLDIPGSVDHSKTNKWWDDTVAWAKLNPGQAVAASLLLLIGVSLVKKVID